MFSSRRDTNPVILWILWPFKMTSSNIYIISLGPTNLKLARRICMDCADELLYSPETTAADWLNPWFPTYYGIKFTSRIQVVDARPEVMIWMDKTHWQITVGQFAHIHHTLPAFRFTYRRWLVSCWCIFLVHLAIFTCHFRRPIWFGWLSCGFFFFFLMFIWIRIAQQYRSTTTKSTE